jgi:DnaK suppressor protein
LINFIIFVGLDPGVKAPGRVRRRPVLPWATLGSMDDERARTLLATERSRIEGLLEGLAGDGADDRSAADEQADWSDPAQPITAEENDDTVAADLRDRLAAVERAEARLAEGTYGTSLRSGDVIPDERLEADPAAELTVQEAAQPERQGLL